QVRDGRHAEHEPQRRDDLADPSGRDVPLVRRLAGHRDGDDVVEGLGETLVQVGREVAVEAPERGDDDERDRQRDRGAPGDDAQVPVRLQPVPDPGDRIRVRARHHDL
ncbi:MAG: hypothetical protein ACK559_38880, partial [bacterium]